MHGTKDVPFHLIHFGTDGMPQSNPAQRAFPLGKIGATLPRPLPAANNDAPHENSLRAFLQEEESDFEGRKPVPPENYTNHRVEFLNHKMLTWIEKPAAIGNRGRRRLGKTGRVAESRLTLQRPPRVFLSKYRFRTAAVRWPFIRPTAVKEGKKRTTLKSLLLRNFDVRKTTPMARLVAMLLGMSVRPQREGDARRARLKTSLWFRDKRVFILETTNALLLQSAVKEVEQQRSRRAVKTAVVHKADVLRNWRYRDDKDERPAIALIEEIGRLNAASWKPVERKTPLPRVKAVAQRQRFQDVSDVSVAKRDGSRLQIPGPLTPGSLVPADRLRNLHQQQRRLAQHFQEQKIQQSRSELETDGRVWVRPILQPVPAFVPRTGRRATIIAVSDFGGGERKATMVAELGAKLVEQGDRVLIVDVDYRGTLSEICLPAKVRSRLSADGNTVLQWFQPYPARHGGIPTDCIVPVNKHGLYAVTADQSLGVWEARERAAWLVRPDGGDVRFRLRGMLHSPEISRRFDWILVNCPSRMSTAGINAFTSSDYLMFSPAPKHVSQPRIGLLLAWLARLNVSTGICRGLSVLGAVQEEQAPDPIKARLQLGGTSSNTIHSSNVRSGSRWNDGVYYFANTIPTTASVANAARQRSHPDPIARACKQGFANLAREMKARADRGRGRT